MAIPVSPPEHCCDSEYLLRLAIHGLRENITYLKSLPVIPMKPLKQSMDELKRLEGLLSSGTNNKK